MAEATAASVDRRSRIVIVDDDPAICELVAKYLERDGFDVRALPDGAALRAYLTSGETIDLIVLDLMLPGEDGLSLCRFLAQSPFGHIPVLMLTARADDVDRIIGLESGADDYLAKPFVPRELSARIRAILRRVRSAPNAVKLMETARIVRFGDWRLDRLERYLIDRNGVVLPLSPAEYALLSVFVDHACQVLTRDQLLDRLLGIAGTPFDRAIDLRVSRLRRSLEDDPKNPSYIRTIRNEGYVFTKQVFPE